VERIHDFEAYHFVVRLSMELIATEPAYVAAKELLFIEESDLINESKKAVAGLLLGRV
jgi:hypothetical protein